MADQTNNVVPVTSGLDWQLAFRGSVNRWECDENDHLNVRFYSRMVGECLDRVTAELGMTGSGNVVVQHMRYLAEARLAAPVSGHVARVATTGDRVRFLTELRHTFSGVVFSAFLTELEWPVHGLPELEERPLPPHAGPRGLALSDTAYGQLRLHDVRDLGFHLVGRGTISSGECDGEGRLQGHALMGRMSDGMPNLWSVLQTAEEQAARANGFQGGAVLEYRMIHHGILRAGDRYDVWSGVRDVRGKLQFFVHLLFDATTGRCVMSGEAVAVVLDLVARKAVEIPAERRERMLERRVRPL